MRRGAHGYPISLDLEGKRALVVGGDAEAEDQVGRLLDAGAIVTVIAEDAVAGLASLAARSRITLLSRELFPADLRDADVVLVCSSDPALIDKVHLAAGNEGVALWVHDDPERSHFAMPALARAGRVRIAITTAGAAPALAGKLRAALERDLDARFRSFVDQLGQARERILAEEPDPARRRDRLRGLVERFEATLAIRYPEDPAG